MNNLVERQLNTIIAKFTYRLLKVLSKHKLSVGNLPPYYQGLIDELDKFNKAASNEQSRDPHKVD